MTDSTADAAKLLPCQLSDDQIRHLVGRFLGWRLPKPWTPDNGISYARPNYMHPPVDHDWPTGTNLFDYTQAEAMVRYMAEGLPTENTRSQPAPQEGEPDFRDLADKFTDDKDATEIGEAALCAAFGEHMYRLGLAARPKVGDATNEIAHTKENADAARIIRGLRNIGAIDAIRLIETLGDKLGEERERVISIGFPKHPLRGGVERVYTLEDIEPLLARAEAAEAKLTGSEAELVKADAVISFYHDFDHYEGGRLATADEEKWDEEATQRHAARQQPMPRDKK